MSDISCADFEKVELRVGTVNQTLDRRSSAFQPRAQGADQDIYPPSRSRRVRRIQHRRTGGLHSHTRHSDVLRSRAGEHPHLDARILRARFRFPASAWWRIDSDIDAAADGYVNQTALLNDPNGRPMALSRQLFAVFN